MSARWSEGWALPGSAFGLISRLLWPGVLIGGPEGNRWQRFIYENLDGVCFQCGFFHVSRESCPGSGDGELASFDHPICSELKRGWWQMVRARLDQGRNLHVRAVGRSIPCRRSIGGPSRRKLLGSDFPSDRRLPLVREALVLDEEQWAILGH